MQFVKAPSATAWWLVAAAVVTGLGLWGAARLYGGGEAALAAILVGVVSGLISPVSWHHHLVWIPVAGVALAYHGGRKGRLGGWLILVCSSIVIAAATTALSDAIGSAVPMLIGYLLLQLGAAAALIGVGLGASRLPQREAEHAAP